MLTGRWDGQLLNASFVKEIYVTHLIPKGESHLRFVSFE